MLRIGHKGADALAPGNTLESFAAAVEAGVDAIELDVLRPREDFPDPEDWRRAAAGPARAGGPLLVAHDWGDARRREPITLAEALDAFGRPPLDRVRFDLDLKVAGREDEIVAALAERGLGDRAMVSTMEVSSLVYLRDAAPDLDRGWTLPKVSRDWSRSPWLRPVFVAGSASLRTRLPALVRRRAPELGAWAVWIYHPLITRRLVAAAHEAGVQVIAWTVDEADRIDRLQTLGVDGICTNDPRLLGNDRARPDAEAEQNVRGVAADN
ncbi:MAG: glycerophosphoryl diester phosphodiesterase [Solirubrobacterales bacterium]|jgi:glycerophosphoryl diester phosphodiesterase|nr:glycerophosphoryl diester phosphodiesterase [Solirubrobacterales bacterium]